MYDNTKYATMTCIYGRLIAHVYPNTHDRTVAVRLEKMYNVNNVYEINVYMICNNHIKFI